MSHLIASYLLAAFATLAYAAAILIRNRRLKELEQSLTAAASRPQAAHCAPGNSPSSLRLFVSGPWLIPLAFACAATGQLAAADSPAPYSATAKSFETTASSQRTGHDAGKSKPIGQLGGLVVDGARNDEPLPGAEVVLRGVRNDVLVPLATTHTDADGHFLFVDLEVADGALYVAGVNRDDIHYPGPRVGLFPEAPAARVRLVCFPGASGESPLVAVHHEIDIAVVGQSLAITESILVMNPSLRGFAGDDPNDEESVSLELRPFPGFERVTFHNEQLGRNFKAADNRLTTSLAWPPGQREIKFSYQLPIELRQLTLHRPLTLPTRRLQLRVTGIGPDQVRWNIADASVTRADNSIQFVREAEPLPRGDNLEVVLQGLPAPWTRHLRWLAPSALGLLVLGSLASRLWKLRCSSSAERDRPAPATSALSPARTRPVEPLVARTAVRQ